MATRASDTSIAERGIRPWKWADREVDSSEGVALDTLRTPR
jgi:hypothetical protein